MAPIALILRFIFPLGINVACGDVTGCLFLWCGPNLHKIRSRAAMYLCLAAALIPTHAVKNFDHADLSDTLSVLGPKRFGRLSRNRP